MPVPAGVPAAWRERWAADAVRHGQHPLPEQFLDGPGAAPVELPEIAERNRATVRHALAHTLRILRERAAADDMPG